ncbi:MAG TPA: hypothetical protein VHI78_07265 [Bacteroidales bacterium]|nr:hypothetical protein [Bacteroidales bacterium]
MKKFGYFIILIYMTFLFSCEKENSRPYMTIAPENLLIESYNDEKLVFYINVYSDVVLQKLIISSRLEGEQETILLDSSLIVKNFNYEWVYNTPADIDDDIFIYFNAINGAGEQTKLGRRIVLTGKKLQETTGLKMYSYNAGGSSAFNLATLQPESLSADSTLRDIQELQNDPLDQHLSNKLFSPSGCTFVKFNDFDYGNASSVKVKSAYAAGIPLTEVSNIHVNDIYIIKINKSSPQEIYAVLKITGLFDNDGTENDFYEFSVKK